MKNLNRAQFIKELGLSSSALMALYCLGGVTSCKSEDEPDPNNGNTNNGNTNGATKVDFTIDLSTADYSKLKTEGEYIYKDKIIIAHAKGGNYIALSKTCTHQGVDVQYRLGNDDIRCPQHGSEFSIDGSVKKSPAMESLKKYKTELNGNSLRITE